MFNRVKLKGHVYPLNEMLIIWQPQVNWCVVIYPYRNLLTQYVNNEVPRKAIIALKTHPALATGGIYYQFSYLSTRMRVLLM